MAITPVEILHTQFKAAFRGYNKLQVDEFVRKVRESLEEALNAKSELQRRVEDLEEEVKRVREIESTMTSALTLAQRTADELRTNAHRQAEMILREAEQERIRLAVDAQREAERLRGEIGLLEATRDRLRTELRTMLTAYLEWLDRGLPNEIVACDAQREGQEQPPVSSPLVGEGRDDGES